MKRQWTLLMIFPALALGAAYFRFAPAASAQTAPYLPITTPPQLQNFALPDPAEQRSIVENLTSDFSLRAIPQNPDPGDQVEVEVVTFGFDKANASYQWYVNGKLDKDSSGRGRSRISLTAGREGETTNARVDVTTPAGLVRSRTATIRAVSVPLYWWADTAVPYWYKGKALPSAGSSVTVLALPNVSNPNQIAYRWEFNAAPLPRASGFGRNTFSFTLSFPVKESIGVTMQDAAGSFSKIKGLAVRPREPEVGLSEHRPHIGTIPERRLQEFSAPSGTPHEFAAVPFFFPMETAARLPFLWNLNGQDIPGKPPDPGRFILTSNPNTPALDRLSIIIEDPARRDRRTSADLEIQLR